VKNSSQFTDTVDYLYSLQRYGIKFGLENSYRLMDILGRPHESFHSIHITGTNGKGSTSAMIAGILKENGYRVGLYTSPHLVSFTERMRINGVPISESRVTELTRYIRNAIAHTDLKPTFFEFVTAMAFYYFACEKIDWAVVEVGMGGRLDATNVIMPEVSVITNISLEHTEFLGKTIPEIAFEKAGIIKANVPVVTAVTQPSALRVIKERAEVSGSQVHLYGEDFEGTLTCMDNTHLRFNYKGYSDYRNLSLSLTGRYQLLNASVAIRVCEVLTVKGFLIYKDAIYKGLSSLNFEGRLEWVSHTPPIILDGAHNPQAAESLANAMKELFPKKKVILVTGIMKDKDIEGILKPLIDISEKVILTKPKGERAASPEELKDSIRKLQTPSPLVGEGVLSEQKLRPRLIATTTTVAQALELAKTLWKEEDVILVTGSFYTTGEAKEVLGQSGVLSQLRE